MHQFACPFQKAVFSKSVDYLMSIPDYLKLDAIYGSFTLELKPVLGVNTSRLL
jgi:hypothetical protein